MKKPRPPRKKGRNPRELPLPVYRMLTAAEIEALRQNSLELIEMGKILLADLKPLSDSNPP